MLSIVMTRVMVGAEAIDSTPKTNAGVRRISLDRRLVDELRSHKARQSADRLLAGEAWEESELVFVDELGVPILPQTISRRFDGLVAAAGLRRIRLHDTRHTAASMMLAGGTPVHVASKMLGHSSPTITLSIFAHVLPGQDEEAGERQTEALASVAGSSVDKALTWESQKSQDKGVSTAFPQVRTGVGGGT